MTYAQWKPGTWRVLLPPVGQNYQPERFKPAEVLCDLDRDEAERLGATRAAEAGRPARLAYKPTPEEGGDVKAWKLHPGGALIEDDVIARPVRRYDVLAPSELARMRELGLDVP